MDTEQAFQVLRNQGFGSLQARLNQPRSFQLAARSFLPALPCQQPLEPSPVQQSSPSRPMQSSSTKHASTEPKPSGPAKKSTSKSRDEKLASGRAREKERYSANLQVLGKHRQKDKMDALNAALLDPATPAEEKKKLQRLKNQRERMKLARLAQKTE